MIELRLRVPFAADSIRIACAALTTLNRLYIASERAAGRKVPALYESGVTYFHPSGPEQWLTIPDALRVRRTDCKVLACWRAAELLEAGTQAHAVPVQQHEDLFHVIVRFDNGQIEDPSKRLGMGSQRRRVACLA